MVGSGYFATGFLHCVLEKFLEESGLPNTAQTACRCGDGPNELLRKILFVVRSDAGLPDIPSTEWRPGDNEWITSTKILKAVDVAGEEGCRCGDSLFDIWRKILSAVRITLGIPDTAEFSFRFGDSLNILLRKLCLLLQAEVIPVPCDCSDMNDWGAFAGPIFCCEDWGGFSGPIMQCEDWGNS